MTSRLSFLILDAMHLLKIPTNLGIRVHAPIAGQGPEPEILLKRSVEYTIEDGYGVCYSLEKGISEGFSKNGFPIELGRMRVKCGCNWVAIPGREYPLQDVTRVNMAVALHYGLKDLQAQETRDLDLLWERFAYHLQAMVECVKAGYDKHYEVMQRNRPEIVLNLFMHGPIERGLNCSNGGVDILDCEEISRKVSDLLDEADPIEGSYTLEVGSAGAERALKRPADFQRYLNSPVLVKLYKPVDGRKEFPGTLTAYNEADGSINVEMGGQAYTFDKRAVALCRLRVEF